MAYFTTHGALGGGIAALALSAAGAEPNAVSIGLTSAVALRVMWPDLAMIYPTVKLMLKCRKEGVKDWYKARDYELYDVYHHPEQPMNEGLCFKFHRLIDRPYHKNPGENWWSRLWHLEAAYLAVGLSAIYFSFWWLM